MNNKVKKIISIKSLTKIYKNGFCALNKINLDINEGEIFALLGPNGAGKSTLINILCSLTHYSSGQIDIAGMTLPNNRKKIKSIIGLVPQELHLEAFEKVIDNINYSRGLWGKKNKDEYILDLLKILNLYDKRNDLLMQLSGGMKRRVLIAKALSHEPNILFLDEPSAGVDIELRRDMWKVIYSLKKKGVTIILTTHYIEEAEEIADRVAFINNGRIILVENKKALLNKLGDNKLVITFEKLLKNKIPNFLRSYTYKINKEKKAIEILLNKDKSEVSEILISLKKNKVNYLDFTIEKRSLEGIFIDFIKNKNDQYFSN